MTNRDFIPVLSVEISIILMTLLLQWPPDERLFHYYSIWRVFQFPRNVVEDARKQLARKMTWKSLSYYDVVTVLFVAVILIFTSLRHQHRFQQHDVIESSFIESRKT